MGDMKKNILRKGTVLGIIMLFLGISIIPNITGDVGNKKEDMQINEQKSTSSSTTDWWPMFGHDPSHTRYSSSTTPDTCYLLWNITLGYYEWLHSSPAVADGKVYIASYRGIVYCLSADTGAKIWSYTTGSRVESSPAVADGKVYIGSDDHNVYCLNADTGAKIWDYTTGSIVFSGPVVADGKVYLGSYYDMGVYCFGEGGGNHHTKANWGDDGQFGDDGWVYLQYINNKHKYILSTNTAKASNQAFLWLALPIESTSWASVGIKYIPQKTGEAYIIMQGDYSGFIYMALLNLGGGDGWVDISLHVVEKDLYIPEVNEGETYQIFYYQAEVSFRSFDDEFLVPSKGLSIYFQEGIEYLIYLKVKTHIAINKGPGTHTSTGLYWVDFASRGTFFSLPLYNNHVKFSSIDIQYV